MVAIPFPTASAPGENRQETGGRLVNCYAEPLGEGARGKASIKRVPGMRLFGTSGGYHYRGGISVGGVFYATFDGNVVQFTSSGGPAAACGPFPGSAKAFLARNNNPVPDVVAVDPDQGAIVITASGTIPYPDSDVASPTSVCFQGGYFFFTYGDGKVRASGLNVTDINSADYTTAEYSPDGLLRAVPWNNQLYLFGQTSIEVMSGNPPNLEGFPYSRVTIIQRGLAGRYAVAGWEEGFGRGLIFVGTDNGVHVLDGYQPTKISTPDIDRLIEAVEDKANDLEASVYTSAGRAVFVLSGPDWTWEFNTKALQWNERQSFNAPRWRGTQTHYGFGKWLVGDTDSGNIYDVTRDALNEGGRPLQAVCESAPMHAFPANLAIERIDLDVTTGVGLASGAATQIDPRIDVAVSKWGDGVFGLNRTINLGRRGVTTGKVYATRFGHTKSRGAIVRAMWSDEVDISLIGGDMRAGKV